MNDPRFPAVSLNQVRPPASNPQYVAGSPHRLPVQNGLGLIGVPVASAAEAALQSQAGAAMQVASTPGLPQDANAQSIRDPHHYAVFTTITLSTTATSSQKFLDSPVTRRNALMIRNASQANVNIYVAFGKDADIYAPMRLAPNDFVLFDVVCPQDDLYVYADGTGGTITAAVSTIPS